MESAYIVPIAAVVAIIATLGVAWVLRRGKRRALTGLAKRVTFSTGQLAAMRSLWHWYRTGTPSATDPLKGLTTAEMADLLSKCSLEAAPSELQRPEQRQKRTQLEQQFEAMGMGEMQAQILAGMCCAGLGPAKDLSK